MPDRQEIVFDDFNANPFQLFNRQWFLLTAGDFASGKFNTMTVSWGYIGFMWGFPSAIVAVRPQRYTLGFIRECDSFTLSAFSEDHRAALQLCGSKSGRDLDKIAAAGLTPEAAAQVKAPVFKEAELVLECRKVYQDKFLPEGFLDPAIGAKIYPGNDYHQFFAGEIVRIAGTKKFERPV
ncbi:MAG: flavin reductase family protein [Lentisphaerae bacterium]|nr:flavin reductase family protein [Lentisphaerota bacterium]